VVLCKSIGGVERERVFINICCRLHDQSLAISSHGVLTVVPSLCYHSVLNTTDKLFVLPLLRNESLRLDTVVGAGVVQPADDNRAAKSETKSMKVTPALWQSIHSIIHTRSQPVSIKSCSDIVIYYFTSFNLSMVRQGLLFLQLYL